MPQQITKLIGPPGTGKTRTLIGIVEDLMKEGVSSQAIGYIAFTRKAANEAKDRAMSQFNLREADLPYFRTIHSFAFRQLGLSTNQMMDKDDYDYLGEVLGLEIRGAFTNYDDGYYESPIGDKIVFIESVARNMRRPLEDVWYDYDNENISLPELERYAKTLQRYKDNKMLLDYTDILDRYVREGYIPTLEALVVDEAQDLSALQWEVVDAIGKRAKRVYFAGDDDQCIYRWAGADVSRFIDLEGDTRTLSVSHRLPTRIREFAEGISGRISKRLNKVYKSSADGGNVEYVTDVEEVDMSSGTWYLLGRNSYLLRSFEGICMREGFSFENFRGWRPTRSDALKAIRLWTALTRGKPILGRDFKLIQAYKSGLKRIKLTDDEEYLISEIPGLQPQKEVIWHEALDQITPGLREYFIAALRRGEDLINEPRIKISTIHGVKGGQADNVVVLPDMSKQTYDTMLRNEDDEHRVFYVAVTRAKENLFIAMPQTNLAYDL